MSQLALSLIEECIRTQNPYLDLGRCGLTDALVAEGTTIDIALRQCTHLKTLIFSNQWWKGEWINSQNTGEKNFFTTPPPTLSVFSQLHALRCSGSYAEKDRWQIADMTFVANMKELRLLDISSNQISEIKGLEALTNLQQLDISRNQISEIKGLEALTNLQQLDISRNQISEIKGLEALNNLQILSIFDNQISEIKGLDALLNLQQLNISSNQITRLEGLDNLIELRYLYFDGCELTQLGNLDIFINLQLLHISSNQLTDIGSLKPLIQRKENPLQIIIESGWANNGQINVISNPLTRPPMEIVQQGNQAILDWFAANKDTFKEVKVLLIGDAKAGKTSLLRRLKENIYQEGEEQTDGIIIEKFAFKDLPTFADFPALHEATAYFWDFGGQETMSATHQFFMTRRSVYLLLLEARKDKKADEQLRELMEQVQAFGANSQVIVVVNKIDLNTGFGLDSPTLLQDYPQIKDIVYISCKEDLNIDKVKQALANAIPKAELYDTEIDERWKAIKEVLQTQTDTQHYLPENSFLSICNQNKLTERRQQNNAISFLHDLGILLHFEQLDLSEYFVLEPYWVTTGVYQILTSPFAGDEDGKIPVEKLKFIINEEEGKKNAYCPTKKIHYSSNEVRFIADIMTQFKLAYYTADRQTLLVPDLFENKTPLQLTNTFTETADCLRFVYEYSYLPKSILPRFMVEMQIDIQRAWRTGAILQSKQNPFSSALVVVREKQIHIYVKGEHKQKREYLSVIRFFLDKINESLNLKPTLKIPLPGFEKYYAKYEHLLKLERRGDVRYEDLDLEKEFPVSQLLEGIERKEMIEKQATVINHHYNTNNNYTIHVKGDKNTIGQGFQNSEMNTESLSDEQLKEMLSTLQNSLFAKIDIQSTTIQAAIKSSSTQQVQQMEKMLQEINGMSTETQAQLWDGFSLLAQRNQAIKTFVEKVEAERVARQIEDSANVKLKIGLPFMIKEILGVGVEYETTLADGKTFFDWFKKWQGIVL